MNRTVDVAILGAGHAGLNAVKSVRKATENFVLVNGGPLGTTCARVGCMPSKAAVQIATDFQARRKYDRYGISGGDALSLDVAQAMEHIRDTRDMFVDLAQANSTDDMGDQLMEGYAEFLEPDVLKVGETVVRAKKIIIATGSRPHVPADLRVFGDRVLTTDDLFEQSSLPETVAVVGLGAIGIEIGQALQRLGVRVVGITHDTCIAQLRDPQVNDAAIETLGRELTMHLGQPYGVTEEDRQLRITLGIESVLVDKLLVCAGRTPNLDRLGIEKLGVALDNKGIPLFNPRTMQIDGLPVFIAGDVTGRNTTLADAANEGFIAGYNAVQDRPVAFKQKVRMSVVFSDPNIAEVGAAWDELHDSNVAVGQIRFGPVGRAFIMGENRGLLRVYGDKGTGRILGASMVGTRTEHLAHLLAWSIQQQQTVFDLLRMPYYHPVIEEGLKDALHDLAKNLDGNHDDLLELERAGDGRAQTLRRALGHPLRGIARVVQRPRYAAAAAVLLAGTMATLSYQADLGDRHVAAASNSNARLERPPAPQLPAAATSATTTEGPSRDGVDGETGASDDAGDTRPATPGWQRVALTPSNVTEQPHTILSASTNPLPVEPPDGAPAPPSSRNVESKPSNDVAAAEHPPPEPEVRTVSVQASRALSQAQARYWVGDAKGAMDRLTEGAGPEGDQPSDADALAALRERLQRLSQHYQDGSSAFAGGDKERAFDSWRAFLIEEQSLQLPTWSAFALEVQARLVEEYARRGDEAEARGRAQEARHLWLRAHSVNPGGRSTEALDRLGHGVAEPVVDGLSQVSFLDSLAAIFTHGRPPPAI